MKKWPPLIILVVLVVLAGAGSGGASGVPHQHVRYQGAWAEARWLETSATATVWTYINVTAGDSPGLNVSQQVDHYDASHTYIGRTSISAIVYTGYTATIKKLRSASVSASNLRGDRCEYGPNGEFGGCVATTIGSISANITADGPTMREISNDRFMFDGFSMNSHSNGTTRYGTATGTINGTSLTSGTLSSALVAVGKGGTMIICRGSETCD